MNDSKKDLPVVYFRNDIYIGEEVYMLDESKVM